MKHLIYSFLILLSLAGCKKAEKQLPGNPDAPWPPFIDEQVEASVHGYITGEKGQPLEFARVTVGDKYTSTNSDGFFFLDEIQIGKTAGKVVVNFPGYFEVTKTIMVREGSVNYVKAQLIPLKITATFPAASGGAIDLGQGARVEIAPNSLIVDGTNITYQGEAVLLGAYLDPTDPDIGLTMPGNLMGLNTDHTLKQLQTYGMLAVILEAQQGGQLNIAPGKTASISVPIPAALQSNAPETMPLWFFDDVSGLWREQGMARKQGDRYSGTVTHFSFWNVDVPNNFILLNMTLTGTQGGAFPFHPVKMTNTASGAFSWATSDSAGVVQIAVPSNAVLLREVFNFCGQVVSAQQIGPFTASTDLGTVMVDIPGTHRLHLNGTVKNCAGAGVTNGHADIYLDGMFHRTTISNGKFSFTANRCTTEPTLAQVTVTDLDAVQYGPETTISVTTGSHTLSDLKACGSVMGQQYISFILADSIQFGFASPADSIYADTRQHTFIRAFKSGQQVSTSIGYYADSIPGTYPGGFVHTKNGQMKLGSVGSGLVSVAESGGRRDYITGNWSGNLFDSTSGKTYLSKVAFKVKRY